MKKYIKIKNLVNSNMIAKNSRIKVVAWNKEFAHQAYELLNKYQDTSLFLLANLKTYGAKLTEDSYSGDFKCLLKNQRVIAVFALTKIGNLIVQTDRAFNYSEIIIDECLKGDIPLRGVVGDWQLVKPLWDYAKQRLPNLHEKACKKEVLFRRTLHNFASPTKQNKHEIRHLKSSDFQEWLLLNKAFLKEQHLDQGENEKAKHKRFIRDVDNKCWLGLFVDGQLVSMATFILQVDNTGLIGSVYTLPKMRKRGLARALICQLLLDGKINKNMNQAILFTNEDNNAAIGLYESLGFKRIGHFGLLFGDYDG